MFGLAIPIVAVCVGVIGLICLKQGPIFLPTQGRDVQEMVKLLDVGPGDRTVDLGSGDGRIVIAMARSGAEAHGYEYNPALVWWSRFLIRQAGLSGRAFIHRTNFWKSDFSRFTVFTVFGIPYIMKPLQEKLLREARFGSRVASYTFKFPTLKFTAKKNGVYIYRLGASQNIRS